jgi:hypothetical protein
MSEMTSGLVKRGWFHIEDALDGHNYMGAFQRTVCQSWAIVGPGRVKDGLFSDYLGDWGVIKAVLKLPDISEDPARAPLPAPPAKDTI